MFGGGSEGAVQTGVVRVHRQAVAHSYANAARPWRRRPFRHYIVNRWIGRVDRRHNPKLIRIGVVNFERVARIVFIGAERRDHDRTVDADTVHRSDHLFACGGVESVRGTGPRPAGMISIEGMNLNVDDWHAVLLLVRPIVRHRDRFAQTDERGDIWRRDPRYAIRTCCHYSGTKVTAHHAAAQADLGGTCLCQPDRPARRRPPNQHYSHQTARAAMRRSRDWTAHRSGRMTAPHRSPRPLVPAAPDARLPTA